MRQSIEATNAQMYGEAPTFDYSGVDDVEFYNAKAFDWYNANLSSGKKREAIVEAAKALQIAKEDIDAVSVIDLSDILFFTAVYGKMVANGAKLNTNKMNQFKHELSRYVEIGKRKLARKGEATPSVQDFVVECVAEFSATLNKEIDNYVETGSSSFSFNTWCQENDVKAIYCDRISQVLLKPLFDELAKAIKNTDEQLAEGWSHVPVDRLRGLAKFVFRMMDDLAGRKEAVVKERMPRISKPKPAVKQVKGLKYKSIDATFGITSIPPTKIVGATELYAFNTKTRVMVCLFADDAKGFTVKGSTVLGVDLKKSYSKTIRKPQDILPVIAKEGKRAVSKQMDAIRAVAKPVKSRVNKDMIILRVF